MRRTQIIVTGAILAAGLAIATVGASDAGAAVPHLTAAEFEESISDGKVHFIKLYAPWCGHCRRLAPTWAELAAAYKGSDCVAIASVDCTKEAELCTKYEVRGYPTLKLFHGGEAKEQYKGPRALDSLKEFVDKQARTLLDETDA